MRPDEFWGLTLHEFNGLIDGYNRRQELAQRGRMIDAWLIAALGRASRLPSLQHWLGEDQPKELTPEEAERRQAEHEEIKREMEEQIARQQRERRERDG